MTRAQLQDIFDCQVANCRYYRRCKVYWGRRCSRLGGGKIPRMRSIYNQVFDEEGMSRPDRYQPGRVEGVVVNRLHRF